MKKTAIITGICGQDGSYLADLLLEKDYKIYGFKRRTSSNDLGCATHLANDIEVVEGDLLDLPSLNSLCKVARPDEFYNLASQSHVGTSFNQPVYTTQATGLGVLNCLEAIRNSGLHTKFYQASTSELFGGQYGETMCTETTPFHPRSPYGVAKLYGYWITVNYRESYKMFTCNGLLFNHECFFADTPVLIKQGTDIDIVYVSSLIANRKDISKDTVYLEKDYTNQVVKIWDGFRFVKLKTVSRKKLHALEEENHGKQITNARCGVVSTTPNHKLIGVDSEKRPASSFEKDMLILAGSMPDNNATKCHSSSLAYLMGMLAGDGYVGDCYIRFTNNDTELGKQFETLMTSLFCNTQVKQSTHESGFGGITTHYTAHGISKAYCSWLREQLYDKKTKHKKVPQQILNSITNEKLAFLQGYYVADGLKADKCTYEFKSFKTNSPLLAQGLLYLINSVTQQSWNINTFIQNDKVYYQVNLHSPTESNKGKHFKLDNNQITKTIKIPQDNQHVFDIETETGQVMAGIGIQVVGNSPRRGPNFVTRKITQGVAKIQLGLQDKLYLGNLKAKRDWGHAEDFVYGMWLMMQHNEPDDYVLATGKTHSVEEFCKAAFDYVELPWQKYVEVDPRFYRPAEVDVLLGDYSKAKTILGWQPNSTLRQLAEEMVDNDILLFNK